MDPRPEELAVPLEGAAKSNRGWFKPADARINREGSGRGYSRDGPPARSTTFPPTTGWNPRSIKNLIGGPGAWFSTNVPLALAPPGLTSNV